MCMGMGREKEGEEREGDKEEKKEGKIERKYATILTKSILNNSLQNI